MSRGDGKVRLGLVGLGPWGRRYIETVAELDDCKLVFAVGSEYTPLLLGDGSGDLVCPDHGLDGVLIATSPESHCRLAEEFINLGIPVMVEKPVAFHAADVERLKDLSARAGVPVLVDHTQLFGPHYQAFKEKHAGSRALMKMRWCGDSPARAYSALYDYGAHAVAMAIDLAGQEPQRVLAQRMRDEVFEILLQFPRVEALLSVGRPSYGSEIEWDDYVYRKMWDDVERPLTHAVRAFVETIRGKPDPRVGLDLAVRVTRVLEECARQVKLTES